MTPSPTFETFLIVHESTIRLLLFLNLLLVFSASETIFPARARTAPRWRRWPRHLGLTVINGLAGRLVGPLAAVAAAIWAQEHAFGLFNQIALPAWLIWAGAVILLDLALYLQHFALHRTPLFWRFHRVHHYDTDLDASTALRFHPIEILASLGFKGCVAALLGAPPGAVIVFEAAVNAVALFSHANLDLPKRIDRLVNLVLVTPNFHRIHHFIEPNETNSNYGSIFSVWDRFFGTRKSVDADTFAHRPIGLSELREPAKAAGMQTLLLSPFLPAPPPGAQPDKTRKQIVR